MFCENYGHGQFIMIPVHLVYTKLFIRGVAGGLKSDSKRVKETDELLRSNLHGVRKQLSLFLLEVDQLWGWEVERSNGVTALLDILATRISLLPLCPFMRLALPPRHMLSCFLKIFTPSFLLRVSRLTDIGTLNVFYSHQPSPERGRYAKRGDVYSDNIAAIPELRLWAFT